MKKIFLLFIILIMTGCSYDPYDLPKDLKINVDDKTYDVYKENIKLKDIIKSSNYKVLNENNVLNTKKLGKNEIDIKIKYKKRIYKKKAYYNVVDRTSPIFLNADTYYNVLINEEKDFKVNVISSYNNSNSSSNNKYTKKNIEFSDIVKNYKNDKNMIGIDISRWQEDIDFKKVKDAGCEFVIIRMGINSDIDKDLSMDTYFKKNIKNAKKAGLKIGVYVYTSSINNKTAREHALWTVKSLNHEKLDFPVAYDWENWDKLRSYEVSMFKLTDSYLTFSNILKENGYDSMLYSSYYYLKNIWMFSNEYNVWLAHYTDKTDYDDKYMMWQMTNIGKIDGIKGDVDIDIYYE